MKRVNPGRARGLCVFFLFVAMMVGCQRYDTLVDKEQATEQAFADLQANLQRRNDLIPNLVAVVRGAAQHEEETLTRVTEARARATGIQLSQADLSDPAKVAQFQAAQDQLHGALSRLLVVQEAYPEIRANQAFHDLQIQIEGTENRILRAREQYNASVRDYNAELNRVGGVAVNRATGRHFQPKVYFTTSTDVNTAPRVQF